MSSAPLLRVCLLHKHMYWSLEDTCMVPLRADESSETASETVTLSWNETNAHRKDESSAYQTANDVLQKLDRFSSLLSALKSWNFPAK